MKFLWTIIITFTKIKCALSEFKRKLIGTDEEYSTYLKKMKTDNINNQEQTLSDKCLITEKADILYKKAFDIYKDFSLINRTPYSNQFIDIRALSKRLKENYATVTETKTFASLEEDMLKIFSKLKDINFKSVIKEFNISEYILKHLKCSYLTDQVLIEFIKLQKYFRLVPELMIIVNVHTNKTITMYLLIYLRILNLYLDTYISDYKSTQIYKENITSFIEGIYELALNVPICLEDQRCYKLEDCKGKGKKEQSELLRIFIMNLSSAQRNAYREKPGQHKILFQQTSTRSKYFLITCYLMLYRHLLLNVIVQNKNYDMKIIDNFVMRYSFETYCIGCMIQDCFDILASPIK